DPRVMAFSSDGHHLALAHLAKIEILDLTTDQRRELLGHVDEVTALAFSPDGRQLVSASFDRTVRVWDLSNTSGEAVVVGPPGTGRAVIPSRDGRFIATLVPGSAMTLVDLSDPRSKPTRFGGEIRDAAFSPNGASLALASRGIELVSLPTGERTALFDEADEV